MTFSHSTGLLSDPSTRFIGAHCGMRGLAKLIAARSAIIPPITPLSELVDLKIASAATLANWKRVTNTE